MGNISIEQLDAAIELANHLPDLRCFPLRGSVRVKMTLVCHCMLQNDPDSAAISTSPRILGRSRKNLAKGPARRVCRRGAGAINAARERLFARSKKTRHSQPAP
jgi:hypothetical protein